MTVVSKHYPNVGFVADDLMQVVALHHRAITRGTATLRPDGSRLARLHDAASGALLEVVVDGDGLVRSARPSFVAPAPCRVRVRLTGLLPDGNDPDADLVQVAVLGGGYPLAVEFEGGCDAIAALPFDGGEDLDLELVGFADALECYADEQAFRSSGIPLATRDVLPAGLVPLRHGDGLAPVRASALVSGVVLACAALDNELGGGRFLHLVIETDGMTVDAVVDPVAVEGVPVAEGRIVTGSLWFRARRPVPVEAGSGPARPGRLRRLARRA